MAKRSGPPGCRTAAIAAGALVITAIILMAGGLSLVNDSGCQGGCETLGLTLLYGGLPVSAVFGVLFGDLVLAWPLDVTVWIVIGFALARYSDNRGRSVAGPIVVTVALVLAYGLVLSQLVEIAISSSG